MGKLRGVLGLFACASIACVVSTVRAQDDEVIQLVVELLGNEDKDIRALAFEQIRTEVPGEAATRKFAELLPQQSPDAQVGLLSALADRGDKAAAPAVRELLSNSGGEPVRVAALKALGKLGGVSDLAVLIEYLSSESADEHAAARRSLVVLPGDDAIAAMAGQLGITAVPVGVMLMEILTERRARDAAPAILAVATDDDADLRRAAMIALGQLGQPKHVPGMVQAVLKAERGREREAAEKAVMLVCHRIENRERQAQPLLDAMKDLPKPDRVILLSALGRVGGPAALEVIEDTMGDPSAKLHAVGVRALCNWPDASVVFRLLELARTEQNTELRRAALKAMIRVAVLPDDRSDQRRLDVLRTAMTMCREDVDRWQVLDRAKAVRTVESLRFVKSYMGRRRFAEPACLTIVELAHHTELRKAHQQEFHRALDEVIATSRDPIVVDRAQRYKKGETWVRPKAS